MISVKRIAATLVAAGLLGLSWVSSVIAVVVPGDPPGLQIAIEVQERHTDNLMTVEGVVGTAVGVRGDGVPVIKIFTEAADIPGLPRGLDGVPVVVQVTGKIFARHHRTGHTGGPGNPEEPVDGGGGIDPCVFCLRPVPIGVSTGHPDITAGTIGARVTDGSYFYALSNNHVYANENLASKGDIVIQPGTYDGGTPSEDEFGTLTAYVPIIFGGSDNVVDAAIALVGLNELGNTTPSDGYGTPKSISADAHINQRVMKYGRTTGLTKGRVDAINATVDVGYSTGVARFTGQIIIRPGSFSAGGDSGSLIVSNERGSEKKKPVGLLFAGSSFFTVANPIGLVLEAFDPDIAIDGE
jgi:hypothetical protein